LIRPTDDLNLYAITARGVWYIEKKYNGMTEEDVIKILDKRFFNVFPKTKFLNEKDRIILLAMISVRSFSRDSGIDLNRDEYMLDAWKRIIEKSSAKLQSLHIIKQITAEDIFKKKGNEHMVARLMRQTTELQKKTKRVFTSAGDRCFYLDVYSNGSLQKHTLVLLLNSILGSQKRISASDFEDISSFCSDIAYSEAPYIFDIEKHIFSSPEFDDIIIDAIKEAAFFA